ncbi:MAG: type II secretion system secretin GspD [Kiritimatiellae bacterium]|nr:type II secretion system secretin GspD [Kiritimatiellia bacterium]
MKQRNAQQMTALLIGVFLAGYAFWMVEQGLAQTPAPPSRLPAVPPTLPAGTMQPSAQDAEDKTATPESYSLKFESAPMELVLQDYSDTIGRTLLLGPGIPKANLSLRSVGELSKTEYLNAIESVLAMHGIALLKEGEKFIRVVPINTARKEGTLRISETMPEEPLPEDSELISQMIQLRHIDINEANQVIDPVKHAYGTVQLFERTNSILVTDDAATVNRIMQLIRFIDQPVETREETHILQIRHAKASDIKSKLEEIIAEVQKDQQQKKATAAKPKSSGQPGVISQVPGVIRARPTVKPVITPEAVAELVAQAERGIIRGAVKIISDDRTNILIILTRPENMNFFEKIVLTLDIATDPDVLVEVYRLEYADAKDVAGMLNDLIGAAGSKDDANAPAGAAKNTAANDSRSKALRDYIAKRPQSAGGDQASKVGELSEKNIKVLADERTNALIIMASKADQFTLSRIVDDMDMMLSQVLIESVILEIQLNDSIATGIDWVQRAFVGYDGDDPKIAWAGGGGGGSDSPTPTASLTGTDGLNSRVGSGLSFFLTLFDLNIDAVISLSSSDSNSKVISAPVIMTTDNTEAMIKSTDKIYVLDSVTYRNTISGGSSGNDYQNYSKEDVGIQIKVTPHINENKVVMMEIEEELSEPGDAGTHVESLAGTTAYKERSISASIAVQSGQTIVLGGLVREEKSNAQTKIPFLGDIPLFGRLFKYRSDDKARTETVVFLTPTVLDTPEEIARESKRRKDALSDQGIWKEGWSNSRLAEPATDNIPATEDRAMWDLNLISPKQAN